MLAGGPETILLTWLLLAGMCALDCTAPAGIVSGAGLPASRVRWRMAGRFVVMVVFVAAICAIQLLPFLDLAAHSHRQEGFADTRWSLPLRGWANFLVPMAFGSTWNQDLFFQYGQYWTSSYYLGMAVLLLALAAPRLARERRVWFLGGATAAAYLLALGGQTLVYRGLRSLLPQLTLMTYPVKFVTVMIFAVPLLAAIALARWRSAEPSQKKPGSLGMPAQARVLLAPAILLVALIAVVLFWEWQFPLRLDKFPVVLLNGLTRAAFVAGLVAVLFVLQRELPANGQKIFSLLLLLVVWLDLWTHEPNQNPTVPVAVYAPDRMRQEQALEPAPALGQSRLMISAAAENSFNMAHIRDVQVGYLVRRLGFFSNCNLLDHVPKVNGFFSLFPRYFGALTIALYSNTNLDFPRLEDFMSVSQLNAPNDYMKFNARSNWLPLVTAGQATAFLDDTNTLLGLIQTNFNPDRQVLLPVEAQALVPTTKFVPARVLSQDCGLREVHAEVEAAEPTVAVFSQAYYHCWRGYVDGKPVPLIRANLAFQAVPIPAGHHQIRLVYEDRAFRIGAVISLLAALGWVGLWLTLRRRPCLTTK